jgi:predicted AAA+ superfamily ATPase
VDFEKDPQLVDFFQSQDPLYIMTLLEASLNISINQTKSILFLDEIQRAPSIIACLRYFFEKLPSLAVIAAGSLLDLTLNDHRYSIPVGRVEYFFLGPLTFEGFLSAIGKHNLRQYLKNYTTCLMGHGIPGILHNQLLDAIKLYFFIGGLPQSIATYLKTKSLLEVNRVKQSLVLSYQDDFSKYHSGRKQQRLRSIFQKIPFMLGEKFKYSNIDREEKSTVIKEALEHLISARLLQSVYNTSAQGLPLGAQVKEKDFKTYFLDIGLALSVLGLSYDDYNFDNHQPSLVNVDQLCEQFVAQELLQLRPSFESPQLYYWLREAKSSNAEVDFVITHKGTIIPIEVKSGSTGALKSLHIFMKERGFKKAIRFCLQQPSTITIETSDLHSFELITLPFYLIGQIHRLC